MTVLSSQDETALQHVRETASAEHNELKDMADNLIAMAGEKMVMKCLPLNKEEYIKASNGGEKGLGIIVLDNLDSHTNRLICDYILSQQKADKVLRTAAAGHDEEDDSSAESAASESSWNPASVIDIRINRSLMKNEPADLVYLSSTTAADARNSFAPGKVILCAATIEETRDTIGNDSKIDSNKLMEGIVNHVTEFMEKYSEEFNLPFYTCQNRYDPLKTVLGLLCRSSYISVNPYNLAIYACAVWKNMDGGKDIYDLRRAIGRSLYVFALPSDSTLFTVSNLDKCTNASYSRRLNDMLKARSTLRNGNITKGQKTEQLDFEAVAGNYLKYFVEDTEGNESLSSAEHAIIRNYLGALIHFDQESYSYAYVMLCRIEWDLCLETLFLPKNRKAEKKTLWEQTVAHFNAHKITEDENITDEERDEVSALADKEARSLSKEDQAVLYQFYRSRRRIIEKQPSLAKKWLKKIYANSTYNSSNFMFSLTSCILNLQLSTEQRIERIELRLDVSNDDMLAFNYEAASYFSMRFGPYLDRLQRLLPGRFFVTGPGITVPEQQASGAGSSHTAGEAAAVSPVINYEDFIHSYMTSDDRVSLHSQSTALKATQLKFEVAIALSGAADTERYQITWTVDKKCPLRFTSDLDTILSYGQLLAGSYEQRLYGLSSTEKLSISLKSGDVFAGYQDGLALFKADDNNNLSEEANRIFNRLKTEHASSYPGINDRIEKLRKEWDEFTELYFACLHSLRNSALLYDQARELSRRYALLQGHIIAAGSDRDADNNLREAMRRLSATLLQTGMVWPVNPAGTAIASPFTVESMRGFTARMERLTALLVSRVLNQTDVRDPDMFMDTLKADIDYVEAPELCPAPPAHSSGSRFPMIACENHMGYTLYKEVFKAGADFSPVINAQSSIEAIINFLKKYSSSLPYPPESFTVMVNECRFNELATELYRKLLADKELSKMRFRILFVNRDVEQSQELYRTFEFLRTSPEFIRLDLESRINISVLSYIKDDNGSGTLVNYLNTHTLNQDVITQTYRNMAASDGGNAKADYCSDIASDFNRIADAALLFYVFDGRSSIRLQSARLPVLTDEINAQPSLINRNSTSDSSGSSAGRYIINQMQTAERIVWFNSILFAEELHPDAQNSAHTCQDLIAYIENHRKDNVSFESALPYRYLSDVNDRDRDHQSLDDFIKTVHDRCEIVACLDELQCRSIVEKDRRRIVYYSRIKHSDINLMVSSSAPRSHTDRWLTGIYDNLCSDRKEYCQTFINAARRDASAISGSIVLRAESHRHNTMELTGNVMSRFLGEQIFARFQQEYGLQSTLAMTRPVFLSLDDYISLLKVRKGKLADILGMQIFKYPDTDSSAGAAADRNSRNRYVLAIQIMESKFLQQFSRKDAIKSASQARFSKGIFSDPFNGNHPDRHQWLARLTGMITDNCRTANRAAAAELNEIINIINEGHVDIHVSGLSLVFACNSDSSNSDSNDIASATAIPDFSDRSGDGHRIIQLCLHRNVIKKMFDAYTNLQANGHGDARMSSAPDCRVLNTLLERADMSDLNHYLTRNGPKIISLTPLASIDLSTSAWPQAHTDPEVKPDTQQHQQQPHQLPQVQTSPEVIPEPQQPPQQPQLPQVQTSAGVIPEPQPPQPQLQQVQTSAGVIPEPQPPQPQLQQVQTVSGAIPEPQPQLQPLKPQLQGGPEGMPETRQLPQQPPQTQNQQATAPAPASIHNQKTAMPVHEIKPEVQQQRSFVSDQEAVVYSRERSEYMRTVPKRHYDSWRPALEGLSQASFSLSEDAAEIAHNIKVIDEAMAGYKVKAHVEDHISGPIITRYDLELSSDTKGKEISNLSNDIARQLKAGSIRVITLTEGSSYVGLEVPNKRRAQIHLGNLVPSHEFKNNDMELPVCLGVSVTGSPVMIDLVEAPHIIVAGTTGSGKSAGLNNMLLSLLLRRSPAELRLVLIDPKQLEFSSYRDIPHLLAPVITTDIEKNSLKALTWCIDEMERRYSLMSAVGVKKLSELNEEIEKSRAAGMPLKDPFSKSSHSTAPQLLEPLPHIVIVVEEFADLMAQSTRKKKEEESIENCIARLTSKSRAAGIHLILVTQTPRTDVITGTIKSNLPSRIAFSVQQGVDSHVILDEYGAENLLGNGDMLYKMAGKGSAARAHGSYVTNDDIKYVVNAWKEHCGTAEYINDILEDRNDRSEMPLFASSDPDYDRACAMVKQWQQEKLSTPDISDIQQVMNLDFSRAGRLYNRLKENGVLRN